MDGSNVGSISGHVTLVGKPPALHTIDMSAEPSCAEQHTAPVFAPTVIADASSKLANAVVYVESGAEQYEFHPPSTPATLTQKGCMYEPHVIGVMTGQKLDVSNQDQTIHNVFMMARDNPPTNRSSQPGAAPVEEDLTIPERAIPVKCNVHPWMKGYIFVFDHPFFAVTSSDGSFELEGLPPGTYTIAAWQEAYGTTEQTITVTPKHSTEADFTFKAQ